MRKLWKQFEGKLNFNGFSKLQSKVLESNGYVDLKQVEENLYSYSMMDSPFLLKGAKEFAEQVIQFQKEGRRIAIIGDYDVDGVSATSIMVLLLRYLNADFEFIIPNRFTDGYGLKVPLVLKAQEMDCDVIITVDNGIKSEAAIQEAKELGFTVIVTDHHTPNYNDGTFPLSADLLINPHVKGETTPFKSICGATVAFKLAHATILTVTENNPTPEDRKLLENMFEINSIATVADVMPLIKENRLVIQKFVKKVRAKRVVNPGVRSILSQLGKNLIAFDEQSIGFQLGPLLNAPGRLYVATVGVNIFTAIDVLSAGDYTAKAKALNEERKEKTAELRDAVEDLIDDEPVQVVFVPDANEGLIGIASGNITERYSKPSFVFTKHGDILKGSGRSPENYSIIDGLDRVFTKYPELTPGYGGHPAACGLALNGMDAFKKFKKAINDDYKKMNPAPFQKEFLMQLDNDFEALDVLEEIENLKPYGEGFTEPKFLFSGVIEDVKTIGEFHTSFRSGKQRFVLFKRVLDEDEWNNKHVDIFFKISCNYFRNQKQASLFVEEIYQK